ncbi:MAG: hypothetical protein Terrestrivirus1_264 [Terrestrivirus sp.]|uniref:Uncharacterized protein n=1 Tax=Terrestrivirus sp. TaxID=2487775 RepID=A0A3G4ZKN7_9VIRU|nr:MAG: hypothetical protein Terrestrivirus1_264 [Terrestrivirus sp.]
MCRCWETENSNCESLSIHHLTCYCENDTSCNNEEIWCGNKTCIVICFGDNSCQNLAIYFEVMEGFVLECRGLNACINITVYGPPLTVSDPGPWEPTELNHTLSNSASIGLFFGVIGTVLLCIIGTFIYKNYCSKYRHRTRLVENQSI